MKACPLCAALGDVAKMDAGIDYDFAPIWQCRLRPHQLPRRVLDTKRKRERQARFDRIKATLEGGTQ